ncbi:MAG: GNAT family N-acetyltransferase [Anaplasmataceae bacterium]|nr:GNAT family N-acetyltransferase [Anaplasmataceae bacterium]
MFDVNLNNVPLSNYHLKGIYDYMTRMSLNSDIEKIHMGNIEYVYNNHPKGIFNYGFCKKNTSSDDILQFKEYIIANKIDISVPVDRRDKEISSLLLKHGFKKISTPYKAVLELKKFNFPVNQYKEILDKLSFVHVNNDDLLKQFDIVSAEIFYHDLDIIYPSLEATIKKNDENIQIFLTKYEGQTVGMSIIFKQDGMVVFWGDGVYPKYRKHGFATAQILNRINLVKEYNPKYIIAHCMGDISKSLYSKMGFTMLGDLPLYTYE